MINYYVYTRDEHDEIESYGPMSETMAISNALSLIGIARSMTRVWIEHTEMKHRPLDVFVLSGQKGE